MISKPAPLAPFQRAASAAIVARHFLPAISYDFAPLRRGSTEFAFSCAKMHTIVLDDLPETGIGPERQ